MPVIVFIGDIWLVYVFTLGGGDYDAFIWPYVCGQHLGISLKKTQNSKACKGIINNLLLLLIQCNLCF